MGRGGRYTFDQSNDEDGHPALQDARDGRERNLGLPAGVQLLRTVMAVAANENDVEPRAISFKGAKQALTAFAPKLEAARPEQRAGLVDALLKAVAYHRVADRPGRWEPRARKRRPKPGARLTQPRRVAKLAHNRAK